MRSIRRLRVQQGMRVLVRASLNAPVAHGVVTEDFRLRSALPTINYLRQQGARVILASHVTGEGTETLQPMYEALRRFIPEMQFCPVAIGAEAEHAVHNLLPGEVLMLENLRRYKGEQCNDKEFAESLARLAEVFAQDSFDVLHREHASVVTVPKLLPSYAGMLVEHEVSALKAALRPRRPALAIIGGAKFATKQPILAKLLGTYDYVYVGGALANDVIQARGLPVGRSLVSGSPTDELRVIARHKKLITPIDYVVAPLGKGRAAARIAGIHDVQPNEAILDNGPETIALLAEYAARARTILWNGPLGAYEQGFVEGTQGLAQVIAETSAYAVVGGGDTVAAIDTLNLSNEFSFVSTGGGAMLDFLAKGTLPGLKALG